MFNGKYRYLRSWWIFQQVIVSFRGVKYMKDYENALQCTGRFFHNILTILYDFPPFNQTTCKHFGWFWNTKRSTCHLIPGQWVSPPSNSTSTWIATGRHPWCSPFQSPNLKSKGHENWTNKKALHLYCWFGHPRKPSSSHGGFVGILYQFIPIQAGTLIPLWWVTYC